MAEDHNAVVAFVQQWNAHWTEVAREYYRKGDADGVSLTAFALEGDKERDRILEHAQKLRAKQKGKTQ